MKKFLNIIGTIAVVFILVFILDKLGRLRVSDEKLENYSGYYFNHLQLEEKKMYVVLDEAIKKHKEKIFLGTHDEPTKTQEITDVITAYFYDNPQYHYISNEYTVRTKNFRILKYSTIQLDYTEDKEYKIELKNQEVQNVIEKIVNENIREDMSDFEKEVALHDALANLVTYHKYKKIEDIPYIKHTVYGALVEHEAVCDGYAKAFKMLLDRVGIENIIVYGTTNDVAHAWNMVKIEDKYYHVDVTSNELEQHYNNYVMHAYFNITDKEILQTHTLDKTFEYPECNSNEYNYYLKKDFYILKHDNVYIKLQSIIEKQKDIKLLEVKADDGYYARDIIDVLYDLDFNYWYSNNQTSVSYTQINNTFVFIK